MTETKPTTPSIAIDRRTVLYGAGAVAAGAALAACSSGSSDSSAASTANPATTANAIGNVTPSVEATKAAAGAATDAAAAENGIGNAKAIEVGGGVVFSKQKVVVTQPTAGVYKGFTATCTHQGCLVGSVTNGKIVCPCHGSEFSITDGSVVNGPATEPLAAAKVTVTGGTIKLG